MHKKKIAFFAEKLFGGGVEKILQTILLNFDYDRYDVTLYSSDREKLQDEFYPTHLKHYHYFSSAEGNIWHRLVVKINNKMRLFVYYHFPPSVFYQLFIRRKYDVGIAFIEGYATRILSGAPRNIKKIAWVHTDLKNNHWIDVAYQNVNEESEVYSRYDRIVCVSKVVKSSFCQLYAPKGRVDVLYNPIERDKILDFSKKQLCKELQQSDKGVRIVSLGSLIQVKGYDRLLRIVKRLIAEEYNFELYILGDGNKRKEFESYVTANSLESVVHFMGFLENPYPYLANSDMYVCSSYAEGFNTAITEALILGKAIVSTECSGVKEQLGENNEYGICTPNSEEGLYEGIKQMLQGDNITHYSQKAELRGRDFTLKSSMNVIYKLIET